MCFGKRAESRAAQNSPMFEKAIWICTGPSCNPLNSNRPFASSFDQMRAAGYGCETSAPRPLCGTRRSEKTIRPWSRQPGRTSTLPRSNVVLSSPVRTFRGAMRVIRQVAHSGMHPEFDVFGKVAKDKEPHVVAQGLPGREIGGPP